MGNIHVKVYVTKKVRTPPISVVYGSTGVGIEMEVMDYDLPAGSTAEARATGKFAAEVYKNPCIVEGNIITMYPETGFFVPGGNEFQVVITAAGKTILSFVMDAICDKDIGDGNDPAKPEQVLPLVQRAENAAKAAEGDAEKTELYAGKAAANLETVLEKEESARSAADAAAQSLVGANAARDASKQYADEAKDFANTAAGYAGAVTVSIGWDADGYFSIFEQEE